MDGFSVNGDAQWAEDMDKHSRDPPVRDFRASSEPSGASDRAHDSRSLLCGDLSPSAGRQAGVDVSCSDLALAWYGPMEVSSEYEE
ncbi:hypothetical protein GCM10010446_29840 [Streptomyces enissocaesilis]|uniref:Uncharacterized protein n=1 Tax=Streptomyces enissocaesilis TaxID=332589 RepID=A0ABN3X8A4_9ACTN